DQFGGPGWDEYLSPDERRRYHAEHRVPLLIAADGQPLKRNFVHVDDLVEAMLAAIDHPAAVRQLFNIAITDPADYGGVAGHLDKPRGLQPVRIETPLHSNPLDNSKARLQLGWSPRVDTRTLVDAAFDYVRAPDDARKVWYVG